MCCIIVQIKKKRETKYYLHIYQIFDFFPLDRGGKLSRGYIINLCPQRVIEGIKVASKHKKSIAAYSFDSGMRRNENPLEIVRCYSCMSRTVIHACRDSSMRWWWWLFVSTRVCVQCVCTNGKRARPP